MEEYKNSKINQAVVFMQEKRYLKPPVQRPINIKIKNYKGKSKSIKNYFILTYLNYIIFITGKTNILWFYNSHKAKIFMRFLITTPINKK